MVVVCMCVVIARVRSDDLGSGAIPFSGAQFFISANATCLVFVVLPRAAIVSVRTSFQRQT